MFKFQPNIPVPVSVIDPGTAQIERTVLGLATETLTSSYRPRISI